jgi:hypothetical protein
MPGIHQTIADRRASIAGKRATLADPEASPSALNDAGQRLPRLERELGELCTAAHTGENASSWFGEMITKLTGSPVQSEDLTLAIRHLEDAGFRLRRHLGEKPD